MDNKKLLEVYNQGFHDELWGTSSISPTDELEVRAYNLGVAHAIIGDDVPSVDYLPNNEILRRIKN